MDFPRKIHIDTRFREQHSESTSNFIYELARVVNLPKKCAGFITDVSIPCVWRNIDVNGKYFYFLEKTQGENMSYVGRVELEPSNYTASSLAHALGEALTLASPNGYTYHVAYDSGTGTLSITTPVECV